MRLFRRINISSVLLNVSLAYASDLKLFDGRSSVFPFRSTTVIKTTGCQMFVLAAAHDSCRQLKFIKILGLFLIDVFYCMSND